MTWTGVLLFNVRRQDAPAIMWQPDQGRTIGLACTGGNGDRPDADRIVCKPGGLPSYTKSISVLMRQNDYNGWREVSHGNSDGASDDQ